MTDVEALPSEIPMLNAFDAASDKRGQTANSAVHFFPEAFGLAGEKIFGRQSAGAGFLRAFFRHGGVDTLYCCTPSEEYFNQFRQIVTQCQSTTPTRWISYANLGQLTAPGCLYQHDPFLADLAWQRRRLGSAAASLCGVTHTLCTGRIMDAIGALVIAPLEHWDALVCTSQTAKDVVGNVLRSYLDYLRSRGGREFRVPIELPIIPLGVDCDSFDRPDAGSVRAQLRAELGTGIDDVALLYVGRLSFYAKAHPLAMYTAAEEVAKRTGKRLHLLHFGWFSNQDQKSQFAQAARQLCPSVVAHFLDERQDWSVAIWHAADIFVSLSDNLQETFGLTPVEAMAAGLPQVVTDWNGYRDTVRHGIDGFRVPTLMPPGGMGRELISRYALGIDNYDSYVGNAIQSIAVDFACCVAALEKLVSNQELRTRMGRSGRERARAVFDWRVVIGAYQELWTELAARRAASQGVARTGHPLREDPFAVFAGYATCTLDANCIVHLGPNAAMARLREISAMQMNAIALHLLCQEQDRAALIEAIDREGPILIGDLLEWIPAERHAIVLRTLGWLAKMDVIRVAGLDRIVGSV